jgi:hypothetical protein
MLTNEKVLTIFKHYLDEDSAAEVVLTSRGHTTMLWDNVGKCWQDVTFCGTPKALFDALLESFRSFQEWLLVKNGERELTQADRDAVEVQCQVFLQKYEEENK